MTIEWRTCTIYPNKIIVFCSVNLDDLNMSQKYAFLYESVPIRHGRGCLYNGSLMFIWFEVQSTIADHEWAFKIPKQWSKDMSSYKSYKNSVPFNPIIKRNAVISLQCT